MGLDNVIYVRSKDKINRPSFLTADKDWRTDNWDDKLCCYEYEVAYWRKCYNVRNALYEAMRKSGGAELLCGDPNNGDFKVSFNTLDIFIDEYKKLLNKETWNSGESIWDWDETEDILKDIYDSLVWLRAYMATRLDNNETEIIFVDSW